MSEIAEALNLENPKDALTYLRAPLEFLHEALSRLAAGAGQEDLSPQALEGLAVIMNLLALICTEALNCRPR
jgi:hypothetical protein